MQPADGFRSGERKNVAEPLTLFDGRSSLGHWVRFTVDLFVVGGAAGREMGTALDGFSDSR